MDEKFEMSVLFLFAGGGRSATVDQLSSHRLILLEATMRRKSDSVYMYVKIEVNVYPTAIKKNTTAVYPHRYNQLFGYLIFHAPRVSSSRASVPSP